MAFSAQQCGDADPCGEVVGYILRVVSSILRHTVAYVVLQGLYRGQKLREKQLCVEQNQRTACHKLINVSHGRERSRQDLNVREVCVVSIQHCENFGDFSVHLSEFDFHARTHLAHTPELRIPHPSQPPDLQESYAYRHMVCTAAVQLARTRSAFVTTAGCSPGSIIDETTAVHGLSIMAMQPNSHGWHPKWLAS